MDASFQTSMQGEKSPRWELIRREMHQAIDERNDLQVRRCLETAPHLKKWLHPDSNESAMHRAVKNNAFYIYGLLLSHACMFGSKREKRCFDDLNPLQRSELQRQRFFVTKYEGSYVEYLKNRTDCQTKHVDFETSVDLMYDALDNIELIRPILQVAATAHNLRIRLDLDRDDVQPMVGCSGTSVLGITDYDKEEIFVAAKMEESTDATLEESSEALGTLAHELCHIALHLVYRNTGKPYCSPDLDRKQCYENVLERIERKGNLDEKIRLAFDYATEQELIVRVPHILAQHGSPGEGHAILEGQAPELLKFYKELVLPDMNKYIKNACPGSAKDAENIKNQNTKLQKADKVDKLGVNFDKPKRHQDFKDVPLLILTGPELSLLEILTNDAVKSTGKPYLFFEASQWDFELQCVLIENKCSFVILTCDDRRETSKALSLLSQVCDVTGTRVLLIVSDVDRDFYVTEAQRDAFFEKKHHVADVPEASFSNISRVCIDQVRKGTCIQFQGRDNRVPLEAIIDLGTFADLLSTATFLKLCESKLIEIGSSVPKLERYASAYYMDRRLERKVEVDVARISLDSEDEAFAFYECSRATVSTFVARGVKVYDMKDLNGFEKFVILENRDAYELLTNRMHFRAKTVHLLKYDRLRNSFVWICSNGSLSHLPWVGAESYREDYLVESQEKVVVIRGEPGIGKSALACHILRAIEKEKENSWVFYIDLAQNILCVESKSNVEDVQQLALLFGVRAQGLELAFFQHSLHHGRPFEVVVIFDGFDEIDEDDRQYILQLVQHLRSMRIAKIFLLSRNVFRTSIEDSVRTVSLELLPFSLKELPEFLKRFWKENGANNIDDERLDTIATQTINKYGAMMGKSMKPLDNPLLIRMVGELETDHLLGREPIGGMQSSEENRTKFDIYKKFVDYKQDIQVKEKMNLDPGASTRDLVHRLKQAKKESQRKLSLLAAGAIFRTKWQDKIVTPDEQEDMEPDGELMKEAAESLLGDGLLDGVRNGVPVFTHTTFAEFFAAQFLFNKVKRAKSLALRATVLEMYLATELQGVMFFLDSFAASSSPSHASLIGASISSNPTHFTEQDMHHLDEFSRTPLHLAALHVEPDVLKALPVNCAVRAKDIFGMTPLMYADKLQAWDRLDVFCCRYPDDNVVWAAEIPTAVKNLTGETVLRKSALFKALQGNLCSLMGVLLRNFCRNRGERGDRTGLVDVDTIRDNSGGTLLFHANSSGTLQLLLSYCDPKVFDVFGKTALHHVLSDALFAESTIACERGTSAFEAVELPFLHLPVDVYDDVGRTPLFLCICRQPKIDLVRLLLLRSRTNINDRAGRTPLELALEYGEPEALRMLLPHSCLHNLEIGADTPPPRHHWWIYEEVLMLSRYGRHFSDIYASFYYSPEKVRRVVHDAKKKDTYHAAFQALFPYLSISDGSKYIEKPSYPDRHSEIKRIESGLARIARVILGSGNIAPLSEPPAVMKQLVLLFDVSPTSCSGRTSLH
ncbi:uncharacterized protein LOC135376422 [Ornithodoros turicata]|uniref:uncharacterized protein LOC135376422 n=1 Tax=Ornithodoros turicata TaxID=34597 RepID=UPI003138E697